jgi:hypothetical protein
VFVPATMIGIFYGKSEWVSGYARGWMGGGGCVCVHVRVRVRACVRACVRVCKKWAVIGAFGMNPTTGLETHPWGVAAFAPAAMSGIFYGKRGCVGMRVSGWEGVRACEGWDLLW